MRQTGRGGGGALLVRAAGLPAAPLDAAAHFHAHIVPAVRAELGDAALIVVAFEPADHTHRGWRLAAIQELAREAAPHRVNGIVASPEDREEADETIAFLHNAPGVTGQLLTVAANR